MKKILLLAGIALAVSCKSTKNDVASSDATITKYMNTITVDDLKKHLTIIASDEMEGRETGSAGQKKAGQYLIGQYEENKVPFPKGATNYYQIIPAAALNKGRSTKLPDSENIWAFIEGSEKPEEIIVISAHYDHVGIQDGKVFNGADDDGTGTVALLEIAQAFEKAKKDGHGPKRSILLLHVTGEEHGLLGSRFYTENPLFPIANTVADINIDMIGRRDTEHPDSNNYVYVIGADRLSSDLDQIVAAQNEKFLNLDLDYKFNDRNDPNRYYNRSDHYNFAKLRIPSVFFFNGTHADYHGEGDEVSKIEFDALAKRTKLAFLTAWDIANRADRIVVDKDGK
jgi:Zn-dependent M28 family amino/carboxypeptidase